MLATPAVDVAKLASRLGMRGSYARFRTKVRGLPEFGGELPVAALAEEIESEGRTKIRALVTMAGNPVSSAPNGPRLGKALETLDFMVSVDLYRNETTRHAHILLPPTFGLERDHYDLVLYAFAVRNVARYAEALFAPRGDTRHDFDILTDLAGRVLSRRKPTMKGLAARAVVGSARAMGSRRILDLLLRTGPYGTSLEALRAEPHGVDFGALEPRLAELLEGRPVDLAPKPLVEGTSRLDAQLERSTRREGELLLVGRRGLRSNNSWMHNVPRLTRGAPVCTLLVHPDDAAPRGLGSGDRVKVRSRAGELVATVTVSDEIGKGSVSLPHGYGHSGTELRVARELAGANVNDVTDETRVDTLSGTAVLNGVPVTLTKLAVGESSAAE
jgi:anaerobic selenocysteine-containing dehydrogenase